MEKLDQDIRWQQRLTNYSRALERLTNAVQLAAQRPLSELEQQGLIQAFEFTHELAWNVMKDYFFWQGTGGITGSRDATREAFNKEIIEDGEGWMEMVKSRNLTFHTYNQDIAEQIVTRIIASYHPLFIAFEERMRRLLAAK
jgi:nucleotidyltransferase substrate binding protein (TIGR01987 family)